MNHRALLAGVAAASALALPGLATTKTVSIDRRPPVSQYCPIDNQGFDLTFVAEEPFARVSFTVTNTSPGGVFLSNRIDNVAVIAKTIYDAHKVVSPGFGACYASPGDPNTPALDFNAAGTPEAYLNLFDTNAAGWDLNTFTSFQGGGGAPRIPATGSDTTGGQLVLGRSSDGAVDAKTSVLVSGLTPGVEYIVTGWWYVVAIAQPLKVTIDSDPCVDEDGDGASSCVDCDDRNPSRKPGADEACDGVDNDCDGIVDEGTPCAVMCDPPTSLVANGRLTNTTTGSTHVETLWTGTEFGLFYEDSVAGSPDIHVARVSAGGAEIGQDQTFNASGFVDKLPRAAWTGTEYGVVWLQNKLPVFQLARRDGAPLGSLVHVFSSGFEAGAIDVAWTGSEFGVVWTEGTAVNDISSETLYFQILSRTGLPQLPTPIKVNSTFLDPWLKQPRIVWNGTSFGVSWIEDPASPRVMFRRLPRLSLTSESIVNVAPTAVTPTTPVLAAGGSGQFGIAWYEYRDGAEPEIYFARLSAAGVKLGTELRVTNAAGQSFTPTVAWSGAEWGLAWDDLRSGDEEIWFARVSAAGVKQGSDIRVTNSAEPSRDPSIVWAGGKFGVAWSDWRDGGNAEIYFTPIGCDCVDADVDGFSSCVDCDDGDATVYPGAPQTCNGVTNDCNNPVWPVPLGVTDEDGDGLAPCNGDCDDVHASVFPGAPQICDGLNNSCTSSSWPYLDGTNERDNDGDGFSTCGGDCNDLASNSYGPPGEARSLALIHSKPTGVTTLLWLAPTSPGGDPFYDTIRSSSPADFTTAAVCVEQDGGGNTVSSDATSPGLGEAFYYLIRAENLCPGSAGIGTLGTNSAGVPRAARTCP
jgi:hypothetical protein